MWQIEFESAKFSPYLPEECQVNPGVYGFELAQWLSQKLAAENVITSYPNYEDWGWFIEYSQNEIDFMICCGSMTEPDESSSNQPITWTIYIEPHLTLSQKLKHVSGETIIQHLGAQITKILEQDGIQVRQS
jgi:hypothetical protein